MIFFIYLVFIWFAHLLTCKPFKLYFCILPFVQWIFTFSNVKMKSASNGLFGQENPISNSSQVGLCVPPSNSPKSFNFNKYPTNIPPYTYPENSPVGMVSMVHAAVHAAVAFGSNSSPSPASSGYPGPPYPPYNSQYFNHNQLVAPANSYLHNYGYSTGQNVDNSNFNSNKPDHVYSPEPLHASNSNFGEVISAESVTNEESLGDSSSPGVEKLNDSFSKRKSPHSPEPSSSNFSLPSLQNNNRMNGSFAIQELLGLHAAAYTSSFYPSQRRCHEQFQNQPYPYQLPYFQQRLNGSGFSNRLGIDYQDNFQGGGSFLSSPTAMEEDVCENGDVPSYQSPPTIFGLNASASSIPTVLASLSDNVMTGNRLGSTGSINNSSGLMGGLYNHVPPISLNPNPSGQSQLTGFQSTGEDSDRFIAPSAIFPPWRTGMSIPTNSGSVLVPSSNCPDMQDLANSMMLLSHQQQQCQQPSSQLGAPQGGSLSASPPSFLNNYNNNSLQQRHLKTASCFGTLQPGQSVWVFFMYCFDDSTEC